jgi:AAA15 family ATPase/GTPase
MFINKIEIENFKSLHNISLDLNKITVLIGPNGSGKSSLLQVLSIIKQSLMSSSNNRGQFTLNGDILNLGTFDDVLSNHDKKNEMRFYVEGTNYVNEKFETTFGGGRAKFSYGFSILKGQVKSLDFSLRQGTLHTEFSTVDNETRKIIVEFKQGSANATAREFGGVIPKFSINEFPGNAELEMKIFQEVIGNGQILSDFFDEFHYIPASRVIDEYSPTICRST